MGGIRIGRIAGIDILIHPSWFLVFALLTWSLSESLFLEEHPGWGRGGAWTAGVVTSLLLFGSLLLHEFSHCYVARRLGLDVKSVTLFIFGGVSSLKGEPKKPADEFRIAIVGPITSFGLAGVFALAGLALWDTGADTAAFYLALINTVLGVFNLLPGSLWMAGASFEQQCGRGATACILQPGSPRRQVARRHLCSWGPASSSLSPGHS